MPGFRKTYDICSFQTDPDGLATPVSILQIFEDAAISHSHHVGFGIDRFREENTGWVLNRWRLEMERYPSLGEKVTVETWPSDFDRFYATREFRIEDAAGNPLGRAGSLWIYLDAKKKRPVRIPAGFGLIYGLDKTRESTASFPDIPEPEDCTAAVRFSVRRGDIDTNGHVNNTRYVEWMIEGIPEELASGYRLSGLEVAYRKETGYGADIVSGCRMSPEEPPACLHRISDDGGQALALGRTVWRKRTESSRAR